MDGPVPELASLLGDGPLPERKSRTQPGPVQVRGPRRDRDESKPGAKRPAGRRFVRDLSIGALLVIALNLFVVQVSIVRGHSMRPFLDDGDRLVVDKAFTDLGNLRRFDVVVMQSPHRPDVDYVKRVIGLPGETVMLRCGLVWIDGAPVDEGFAHFADTDDTEAYVVPPGHLFVLGDNRPISADSREFGLVPGELVRGRVRARVWPLDRMAIWP